MFQLWKLVLLCALLTGTSASVLETLEDDVNNVVDTVKPDLEKGLETVHNILKDVLQKVKADVNVLQDPATWKPLEEKVKEVENLVVGDVSKLVSSLEKSLGLDIGNTTILEIKGEATSDGKGINFKVPLSADVALHLPLLGNIVHLTASMDILTGLRIETNKQTGIATVVLQDCTTDPASVQLTFLDITDGLIHRIVDSLAKILSKAMSFMAEKAVCPVIQNFIHVLDVDFVQNIINRLQNGIHLKITL